VASGLATAAAVRLHTTSAPTRARAQGVEPRVVPWR
jgi:hypothetical protein